MGSGQRSELEALIPPNSLYGWAKRRHVAGGKHHAIVQLIAGLQAASEWRLAAWMTLSESVVQGAALACVQVVRFSLTEQLESWTGSPEAARRSLAASIKWMVMRCSSPHLHVACPE